MGGKFGLVCQLLAEPAQILSYNSLSAYNSLVHDLGHSFVTQVIFLKKKYVMLRTDEVSGRGVAKGVSLATEARLASYLNIS